MGILSALPYMLLVVMMMVIGQIFDRIIARNWFPITVLRKLGMCGSFLLEGSFMLGAALWQNIFGNVFCLVMAVGLGSISKATIAYVILQKCMQVEIGFYIATELCHLISLLR